MESWLVAVRVDVDDEVGVLVIMEGYNIDVTVVDDVKSEGESQLDQAFVDVYYYTWEIV